MQLFVVIRRAIAAQCPEDGTDAPMNHFSLRSEVSLFALESQCPKIMELRENYGEAIETASGKSKEFLRSVKFTKMN